MWWPLQPAWFLPGFEPPSNWPHSGTVHFRSYSTTYRPGLDLVLDNIRCSIKAGEKVGIVGRTGKYYTIKIVTLPFNIILATRFEHFDMFVQTFQHRHQTGSYNDLRMSRVLSMLTSSAPLRNEVALTCTTCLSTKSSKTNPRAVSPLGLIDIARFM